MHTMSKHTGYKPHTPSHRDALGRLAEGACFLCGLKPMEKYGILCLSQLKVGRNE